METVAYKPSEIIGTVKAWLMKQNETAKMVLVEGVYKLKTDIARYAYCYDFKIIFCNYYFCIFALCLFLTHSV